jgi:hypothetical protein
VPVGLGVIVGFQSKDGVVRCGTTSFILMLISLLDLNWAWLGVFRFAIFTLGASVHFLATLIVASKWSAYPNKTYWARQLVFCVPLLILFSIGSIYSFPALSNTAATFACLYVMEKYTEFAFITGPRWISLFVLGGAAIAIKASFFIKTNPEFIVLMFTPPARI